MLLLPNNWFKSGAVRELIESSVIQRHHPKRTKIISENDHKKWSIERYSNNL